MSEDGLSARARKLLERVRRGEYYRAHHERLPKAMKELEDAGLVTVTGRPIVFEACYVPTSGYKPYVPEKFEETAS